MRSRAARFTIGAVAWLTLGAAAYVVVNVERIVAGRRAALGVFEQRADEASATLADARAGQQAYVAAGQSVAFWVPKVAALVDSLRAAIDALRETATSTGARTELMEAAANAIEFGNVDTRAREYVRSDEPLMAADVLFTEGQETATAAARQVEAARLAERRSFDAFEAAERRLQAAALGAASGLVALLVGVLVIAGRPSRHAVEDSVGAGLNLSAAVQGVGRDDDDPSLKTAAELCTALGRATDLGLNALAAGVADLLDASGVIVWLGSAAGADLHPVLTHGYTPETLARIPAVLRSANNAAAAAYRTGRLQVVAPRPGRSSGALVAPMITEDGCIGALAAELKEGGEASEAVQSLATIVAAQLAAAFADLAAAAPPKQAEARAAGV